MIGGKNGKGDKDGTPQDIGQLVDHEQMFKQFESMAKKRGRDFYNEFRAYYQKIREDYDNEALVMAYNMTLRKYNGK